MADFRIWGKVEHIGVKQFLAIVSAVPDDAGDQRPIVLTSVQPGLPEANQAKDRLIADVGLKGFGPVETASWTWKTHE